MTCKTISVRDISVSFSEETSLEGFPVSLSVGSAVGCKTALSDYQEQDAKPHESSLTAQAVTNMM